MCQRSGAYFALALRGWRREGACVQAGQKSIGGLPSGAVGLAGVQTPPVVNFIVVVAVGVAPVKLSATILLSLHFLLFLLQLCLHLRL